MDISITYSLIYNYLFLAVFDLCKLDFATNSPTTVFIWNFYAGTDNESEIKVNAKSIIVDNCSHINRKTRQYFSD